MAGRARAAAALVAFVLAVFGAAGIGSLATAGGAGEWYAALEKPAWTPPGWLFGPVWTVLYAMMAVAAWLVWRKVGWREGAFPLTLFALQLALNAAWSPVFFGLHAVGWGLALVIFLWWAVLATVIAFWRVAVVAGALLLPYQLWLTFAAALNLAIWRMNA